MGSPIIFNRHARGGSRGGYDGMHVSKPQMRVPVDNTPKDGAVKITRAADPEKLEAYRNSPDGRAHRLGNRSIGFTTNKKS